MKILYQYTFSNTVTIRNAEGLWERTNNYSEVNGKETHICEEPQIKHPQHKLNKFPEEIIPTPKQRMRITYQLLLLILIFVF